TRLNYERVRWTPLAVFLLFGGVAHAVPVAMDLPVPAGDPAAAARIVLGFRDDLELVHTRHSLSMSHARFRQLAPDGTPVYGSVAVVHLGGAAPRYRARLVAPAAARVVLAGVRRLDLDGAVARALAAV